MTRALLLAVILALLLPLPAGAQAPSAAFWNPFRDARENVASAIDAMLEAILSRAAAFLPSASAFRIPNPFRIGFRDPSAYGRAFLGWRSETAATRPTPPSPIADTSGTGIPCGGESGDPYWANDCSCRCSRGGKAGVTYEASDRCPEDDNRACEDCRPITRHDNAHATIAACLEHF